MTDAEARAAALAHDDAVTLLKRACVPSLPPSASGAGGKPQQGALSRWKHAVGAPAPPRCAFTLDTAAVRDVRTLAPGACAPADPVGARAARADARPPSALRSARA